MLDQPQDLIVLRRMQRLDDSGMNGVEERRCVLSDPPLPHLGQYVGHVAPPSIFPQGPLFRSSAAPQSAISGACLRWRRTLQGDQALTANFRKCSTRSFAGRAKDLKLREQITSRRLAQESRILI